MPEAPPPRPMVDDGIPGPVPEPSAAPPVVVRPLPWPVRWLLLAFAGLSLATGVIGIFVPGLPTTVFVLMAAWAAARSSPRLYGWLLRHRLFGPMIANWHDGGRVSRRAKWSATVAMAACAVIIAWTAHRRWTAALAIGCMAAVLTWLWRRPEPLAAGVGGASGSDGPARP